ILDADIIFDDSMARHYLRDYDMRIKTGPGKLYSERLQKLLGTGRYSAIGVEKDDEASRELALLPKRTHDECGFGEGLSHELAFSSMAGLLDMPRGGAAAPDGKKDFPEDFIYQVIKDTVMHEVGHTLGLRHNFKASTWKPLAE